jgi:hypothetical protein
MVFYRNRAAPHICAASSIRCASGRKNMPVTTGLTHIKPWGTIEVVTVRATKTPDSYRVVYNDNDLCEVSATDQQDLIDKTSKAFRAKFPNAP